MSRRWTAIAAAVVGFGGILIWAIPAPRPALQGWVVAVSAWAGIPLGSLVLVLVGELTGGRWRDALGPVLQPASRLAPVVVLALLTAFLDLGAVFPWVRSTTGVATDVRTLYLDPTLLAARTAVGLGGLAILSLLPRGHASRLIAALGLAFAALALSVFSVDWMLSIEPGVTSSAYPATIIVQRVLTALGACAWVLSPVLGESDRADLAGLLMTALLGVLYLALMAFIVAWYGNLPDKAAWYLLRAEGGWLLCCSRASAPASSALSSCCCRGGLGAAARPCAQQAPLRSPASPCTRRG